MGTIPVGALPWAITFDGSSIWVTNASGNTVTKLRASDGTSLGTFGVGASPTGITFDGSSIWVANQASGTFSKL